MIHAFLYYNHVSKVSAYKSYSNVKQELLTALLHSLPSQPTTFNNYTLSYETLHGTLFCILGDDRIENNRALKHVLPILSPDPIISMTIANEVFMHGFNPIPHDILKNILSGESHEELLHENMLKNKQAEAYQQLKAFKKQIPAKSDHVNELEAIMRTEPKPVEIPRGKKVRVQAVGNFVVTIREKVNVIADKEGNIQTCVANGDISVKISDEKYKNEEIKFKTDVDCKFSPNINRNKAANNILYSDRGFPMNRNVAVAKWKRECENPMNFSLWASEEGECVVQFEYDSKLNDMSFEFNNKCRVQNGTSVGNTIIWKGKSNEPVEVSCSNYEDMFPVYVDGWNSCVESVNIQEKEGMTLIKIFEVEKYTILYEIK